MSGAWPLLSYSIATAAHHGHANGAIGYLITDWGDNGHWQTLPISFLGFLVGAGLAWNVEAKDKVFYAFSTCLMTSADSQDPQHSYLAPKHVAARLSMHILRDRANLVGQVHYDLGRLYTITGGEGQCNSTGIFKYGILDTLLRFPHLTAFVVAVKVPTNTERSFDEGYQRGWFGGSTKRHPVVAGTPKASLHLEARCRSHR